MKKCIYIVSFVVLLIAGSYVSAQTCDRPISHIDDTVALARIGFFENVKKDLIRADKMVNACPINIDKMEMIRVLSEIKAKASAKNYDGVRVYLALTNRLAAEPNRLTLVLIPTIASGIPDENGVERSDDDDSTVYVLVAGKLSNPAIDISQPGNSYVLNWRNRYQRLASTIEAGLRDRYNIILDETLSLWYGKDVLFCKGPQGPDLLTYLTDCINITQVQVNFASWTYEPDDLNNLKYIFKTDLVFKIVDGGTNVNKYFTLGAIELKKNFKILNTSYDDTGLPCPPNKCP